MRSPFPLFLLLVFLYSCDKPGPIFPLDYADYTTEDPIPSDFRIFPGEDLLSGLYETSKFKTHPPDPLPFEEEKGEFFRIQLAFFLLPSSKNENYSTFIF